MIHKMKIIQVKTHKVTDRKSDQTIKFRLLNSHLIVGNSNSRTPHGARWPKFNCVQMTETMWQLWWKR